MKKIIVAGAGHGGLTAAYNLSKSGYDVTVIEMKNREDLGYDWHDCMDMSAFDGSGVPRPSEDKYLPGEKMTFISPDEKVTINMPLNEISIYMDRKVLCSYLIEQAEEAGAKLIFGKKILGPVTDKKAVKGIKVADSDGESIFEADLVIDACGMHSPVRSNLPEECLVQKDIISRDIFNVYRAYYKNTTGELADNTYTVGLFHINRPGIGWTIVNKDYIDVLVGKFGLAGELSQEEINEDLAAVKKRYPFIGEEIIRAGEICQIPLRRMISKIVCDGYAAVGDSAGMTIPLNGSGIVLSMKAGKILADTVIGMGARECTTENLWEYEYKYFQTLGHAHVMIDILKNFFNYITGEHVDLLMEKGILSADNLALPDGAPLTITPEMIMGVLSVIGKLRPIIPAFIKNMKGVPILPLITKAMPKDYDEKKYIRWARIYNAM